jgi:hypothetical protein
MDLGSAAELGDAVVWTGGSENDERVHSWADVSDHGFSSDHGLTFANQRLDAFRQIQIRPTAKSYDAQTLAAMNGVTLSKRTQDAASDQTGDLHDHQFPSVGQAECNGISFVGIAGLVQTRIEKSAMPIGNPRNRPIDRDPIHMDIQDRKKDRNTPPDCWSKPKLGRRNAWRNRYHAPIRGGQDGAGSRGRYARRIAEEIEAKQPGNQANEGQPKANEKTERHDRQATENERPAGGMRRGKDGS